jgi:hypothetical protein
LQKGVDSFHKLMGNPYRNKWMKIKTLVDEAVAAIKNLGPESRLSGEESDLAAMWEEYKFQIHHQKSSTGKPMLKPLLRYMEGLSFRSRMQRYQTSGLKLPRESPRERRSLT